MEELSQAQQLLKKVEEDSELFIEGISRVFEQPEFQDLSA